MSSFFGIGLMSGNSLDGLDLCHAEFMGMPQSDVWSYRILETKTFPYDHEWQERFKVAHQLSGLELLHLHTEFGHWVGQRVEEFTKSTSGRVDFVSFLGHTAFHQPHKQLTFSLGDGETIAAYLSKPLVTNFGTKDVALGGQGRPLMCFGDRFLYQNYDFCLNLGGQAYISCYDQAFDICPCNILLNYLAQKCDSHVDFDRSGDMAKQGQLLPELVGKLNALPYYEKPIPKALCREWFDAKVVPLMENEKNAKSEDLLHSAVFHIVQQIAAAIARFPQGRPDTPTRRISSSSPAGTPTRKISSVPAKRSMLVTGGGAKNTYLMDRLRSKVDALNIEIVDTDEETIDFKEALITAFLGMRCLLGLHNVSRDMTGSRMDTISGSIHLPPNHSLPASFMF